MPRGTLFKEVELEAIRIGVAIGLSAPAIAHYIKRDRVAIHRQIKRMEEDGTIGMVPLPFMMERIGVDMQRVEALRQSEMGEGKFR